MKVKNTSRLLLVALLLVNVFISLIGSSPVFAYAGYFSPPTYFSGDSSSKGYEDMINYGGGSAGFVIENHFKTGGSGWSGAVGLKALGYDKPSTNPSAAMDSILNNNDALKKALFDLLQEKNSSNDWDKMGSALVVHQMLGRKKKPGGWGDDARTIKQSEWDDLENRLVKNSDITMELDPDYPVLNVKNTAGVYDENGQKDAVFFTPTSNGAGNDGTEYAWVFKVNNEVKYVLEVKCANPMGEFGGLPPFDGAEYDLTPTATVDKPYVEPGGSISVRNTVANTGADQSDQTIWRLTKMVFNPSANLSSDDIKSKEKANKDACAEFTSGGRSACDKVQEKTDAKFNPGVPRDFDPVYKYDIPVDMAVGTKICFTASVSRPTQDPSPVWRHSSLRCVSVSKQPKIQVWGGDLRSGGKINTSISTINGLNLTFGSWGEYGAISGARNEGFASGSGLNNGSGSDTQSSWSSLTFANTGNPAICKFGCYNFTLASSGLVGQFIADDGTPSINGTKDLNNLGSIGKTTVYKAGNVTLSGTTVGHGKTIIVIATGTVTISGSITYEDMAYKDTKDIPQVIIKAPVINIRNNATQVDAWLLAVNGGNTGTLNTCSDVGVSVQLTASICDKALIINGPVVADTVYLRRTGGSDSQADKRGEPAETFNLRADAYMWANASGSGSSRIQTVYTRELSPRF